MSTEAISSSFTRRKTRTRKSTLDVDSTAKLLLKNNPSRLAVYFFNLTANEVSIGFDNTVTTSLGIPLDASGGLIAFNRINDGVIPESEFWLVASADNTNVLCIELLARDKEE